MRDIPQTIRYTRADRDFHSELTKKIVSSNRDAAEKLAVNQDWNAAKTIAGIKDAADELSKCQIEAANKIAESITSNTDRDISNRNDNTDRNIDNRNYNTDRILGALDELRGVFDWKLSELIWVQEKQTSYLKDILKALETPRLTRANELREDALRKYNNGWIEEAIDDFNQAKEENNTDFIVHQSLGNIYLFQKRDPEKALKYYNDAAKYSIEFPYYNSYALLHVGLSNYFLGNYENAYIATKGAIEISPKLIEAYYQNAQYCSKLGRYDEALNNLKVAIKSDRIYCSKTLLEEDFVPMSTQLKELFESLTNEAKTTAEMQIKLASQLIERFYSTGWLGTAKKSLDNAIELNKVGNYLSSMSAIDNAWILQRDATDLLIRYLSKEKTNLENKLTNLKQDKNEIQKNQEQIRKESGNALTNLRDEYKLNFIPPENKTVRLNQLISYSKKRFLKGAAFIFVLPVSNIIFNDVLQLNLGILRNKEILYAFLIVGSYFWLAMINNFISYYTYSRKEAQIKDRFSDKKRDSVKLNYVKELKLSEEDIAFKLNKINEDIEFCNNKKLSLEKSPLGSA